MKSRNVKMNANRDKTDFPPQGREGEGTNESTVTQTKVYISVTYNLESSKIAQRYWTGLDKAVVYAIADT